MSEPNHNAVAIVDRGGVAPQIHPLAMVQQAVERGLDPDTISKLMDRLMSMTGTWYLVPVRPVLPATARIRTP